MAQAITTETAPAVRKYTNIPGKVSEGYQFHELGPKGEVIEDPEAFAAIKSEPVSDDVTNMTYFDYSSKVKSDMGDPFEINVDQEASSMLKEQEKEIFNRWSGGQVQYGGFMDKKMKVAWGQYKQKLLGNAQKIAQDTKDKKIIEYEKKMADFKAAVGIKRAKETEQRLQGTDKREASVKGGLTEEQIHDRIAGMTMSDEDTRIAILKYNQIMLGLEDTPSGRRLAFSQILKFIDKLEKGEVDPNVDPDMKAAHGDTPVRKYTPAKEVLPPDGFVDTGRTSGGKKVYRSVDGKKGWIQP